VFSIKKRGNPDQRENFRSVHKIIKDFYWQGTIVSKNLYLCTPNFTNVNLSHMYAIVEIAGQQFKVENNDEIFVHRLEGEPGTPVEFDKVLLLDDDGKVSIGKPLVEGSRVTGRIIDHVRGDKVVVFKKNRRKGYQKETGHRQDFSKIHIEKIVTKSARAKKAKEEEEAPAAE